MKLAVFGGSFDPVHKEHIKVAREAVKQLSPDLTVIVPSGNSPFDKNMGASFDDRYNMAQLAFSGIPTVTVSDIEKNTSGKSYSYDTVTALIKEYNADECYFILGSDCLKSLDRWYKIDELKKMVKFAVVPRTGYPIPSECEFRVLDGLGLEVSSAVIKGELAVFGKSDSLTDEVNAYVKEHGLYGGYGDTVELLKSKISAKTFEHSVRTALYALRFQSSLGLTFDEVFSAALLHDNRKGREGEPTCGVPAVQHQFDGAVSAKEEFGIRNERILDAIRTHTTGAPDMTVLQKLIYSADVLEPARCYPGVDDLRETIERNFEEGFRAVLKHCLEFIKKSGQTVHGLTEQCYNYYNQK